MNQRLVEILMYVIGEIRSQRVEIEEVEMMSDDLLQKGFTPREVATALSFFIERFQKRVERREPEDVQLPHSQRVLHRIEKLFLNPKAYGYLLQLQHLGVLDAGDIEMILEQVLMVGHSRITEDEVKLIVASHLLEHDTHGWIAPTNLSFTQPPSDSVH